MSKKFSFLLVAVFTIIIHHKCLAKSVNNNQFYDLLERRIVRSIDEWDQKHSEYNLIGNWMILKKTAADQEMKSMANDAEENNLYKRIEQFSKEHQIKVKLPWNYESSRKFLTEARSSKLKKFLIPFVVLMVLKKSIEVPIFLAVVSLVAFKGLGAGLIALMLSGATAFKSLLEHHHTSSKVSYEVVPQFAPSWSRSGIDYPNFTDGYHTIPQLNTNSNNNHTN